MDAATLIAFEESLGRCSRTRGFLDRFYERFLASSPRVREKFADTDFAHQKRALQASFRMLLVFATREEDEAAQMYMDFLAQRHGAGQMDVGAELYDLWLDSLLATVREHDPEFDETIEAAWERVMGVGIRYLVTRYRQD